MAALYVHIPFCQSRCIYCGFYSTTQMEQRQRYVEALGRELQLRSDYLGSEPVRTVYIGGGTPSTLTEAQLSTLISHLRDFTDGFRHVEEFTVECNPDDISDDLARLLRQSGVNRVSMGAQTFNDHRLRFLRRRHLAADIAVAMQRLRQAGIDNISIDLMYGFPGETLSDWIADVEAAIALHPQHLSAYALQYEEGTPLARMLEQGQVAEADEELSRQMYYDLKDRLAAAGYEHYEISNFAMPGRRSLHNSSYWQQVPYLGIGAAAHSYDGKSRQWNVSDLSRYIQGISNGHPVVEQEQLDDDTQYNELIMTRLRTAEGLPLSLLSPAQRDYCLKQAQRYITDGLLVVTPQCSISLTRRGIFVSDMVMADLMRAS